MKIKYYLDKSTLFIYFIGELDECTASKTRDVIDGLIKDLNGIKKVVFNLSELSFMDSTGIGMFIGRYKKLKSLGVSVFTQNPTQSVEKILQISGLYKIMPAI
ncbi:MAG: anti-sigma factor antagonist [Clostridia bacterium]|nr:anti-sigma factor antagonist [Clostridia bacterium]